MASTLTKRDIAEAKVTIWEMLARGDKDSEIIDAVGLGADVYAVIKHQVLDDKAQALRNKPPEHVYVEYILAQERNINDLTAMIAEFKKSKQYNAMVGAIKARADLHDKLIAKGQEFGLFRKESEHKVIAGVLVSELSREDLKSAITGAISGLDKMMSMYGESSIIDVTPGALHHGPALPPPSQPSSDVIAPKAKKASKTGRANRAKTSKRIRGRKPYKKRPEP